MHRIPSPRVSPKRKAESIQRRGLIRKELNRTGRRIGVNPLLNGLLVPVENRWRILCKVNRERPSVRRKRKSGSIAENPRGRPSAYDLIHPTARAPQEFLPPPERQIVDRKSTRLNSSHLGISY